MFKLRVKRRPQPLKAVRVLIDRLRTARANDLRVLVAEPSRPREVTPSLPQQATAPQRRRRQLARARRRYTYEPQNKNDNLLTPIAVSRTYPLSESYNLAWALPYLPTLLTVLGNVYSKRALFALQRLIHRFNKLRAYRQLFSSELPIPQYANQYQSDEVFGALWLTGPDPVSLERVRDVQWLHERFPAITPEVFASVAGGALLSEEIGHKRLFLLDFKLLQHSLVPPASRDSRWRDKYLPAPLILLQLRNAAPGDDREVLIPLAIQLDQPQARAPNPLYLRGPGRDWELAKSLALCADLNHQVLSSHLYRCHFLAEPFALATPRQLAKNHPIHVLLEPHLAYTLQVNHATADLLSNPGSVFDEIYSGTLPDTRQIMISSHARWGFRDLQLERDLEARGVKEVPAVYPYRDDARLLWRATRDFVNEYLRLYYKSDKDVVDDTELQAWVNELRDPKYGNLHGLIEGKRLTTIEALVELVAQFIFTAGPGHAAVHFPQTEFFTFIPSYPAAAFKPPQLAPGAGSPRRLLETLPPIDVAATQFQTNQMGNYRFDKFGDYSRYRLSRVAAAEPALHRFRVALKKIEQEINARNADKTKRPQPYVYLLPSNIPNSINI